MGWLDKLKRKNPSEDRARRKGSPDPVVLGNFLVVNLLGEAFGISEARSAALVAPLPEALRRLVALWIRIYLAWLFRVHASARYGREFGVLLIAQARAKLQQAESLHSHELADLGATVDFWFDALDNATSRMGTTVAGQEIPFDVFAALSFLALDPGSPFYQNRDPKTDGVEFDIGIALASAREDAMPTIESVLAAAALVD